MFSGFNFFFLFVARLSLQFEYNYLIIVNYNQVNTVNFIRSFNNTIFISCLDNSVIYDVNQKAKIGNFDNWLNTIYSNPFSPSYPEFYFKSIDDFSLAHFYVNCSQYVSCSINSLNNMPPESQEFTFSLKATTSDLFFFGYIYHVNSTLQTQITGIIDCVGQTSHKGSQVISSTTTNIVFFVSYDEQTIGELIIDNVNNTIRTFSDFTLDTHYDWNYTELTQNIVYGKIIGIENGNYIFCYNTTLEPDSVFCEIFAKRGAVVMSESQKQKVIICPTNRNITFDFHYLGKNRAVVGCGISPLAIQVVDTNLKILKDTIVFEESSLFQSFLFTPISTNKLFLIGVYLISIPGLVNTNCTAGIMYFGFNDEERDSGSDKDNRFSYFLNTSIKAYQKCNSNCLICIEKENQEHCLQCDNDNDYYIIRYSIQACRLQTMIIPRFYFNETEKAFIQCDNAWHINSSTLRVICVDICPEGSFIDKESNLYVL